MLHDYPTSASEILSKATIQNRVPERSSTIIPSSSKNGNSDDWGFFNSNRVLVHRKSDAAFTHKTSLSQFAKKPSTSILHSDEEIAQKVFRTSDPQSNEISEIIKKHQQSRVRRNSTDTCSIPITKQEDLFQKAESADDLVKPARGNSADLLINSETANPPKDTKPKIENFEDQDLERATVIEIKKNEEKEDKMNKKESQNASNVQMSNPFEKAAETPSTKTLKPNVQGTSTNTYDKKQMSFGEKAPKPPVNSSKVSKNLADIEALLEYDGDDIDQLAMGNSKDALRIMDSIEDMIDARIAMLTQEDVNFD